MRTTTLGLTAVVAAISQAFLLPPSISTSDNDIVNTLPFDSAIDADGRLIAIDCPGCAISIEEIQGGRHEMHGPNRLQLNFSISHEETVDRLLLNGLPFFPIDTNSESRFAAFTAPQMIKTPESTWVQAATPQLGFSLSIQHPVHYSKEDQLDLVTANFEIIEVGRKFVDGVPSVELKLLQTPSGKLMIGDAQIVPAKSHVASPTDDGQECATLLCKWRAIIADRLAKLKGIKGCKGGKTYPAGSPTGRPQHGHGRPRPHAHHGGHGEHGRPHRFHHKHHSIARFLRGIVLHIFVPVIIGIMAGITASLVGMAVGHTVIFVWRLLFRRGSNGAYAKVHQEMEEGIEEEKNLIQHQGPPPVYEDAIKEDKEDKE